jgi:hypothetical protein
MRDLYYFFRLSRGKGRHSEARTGYAERLRLFLAERRTRDCPGYLCNVGRLEVIDRWLGTPKRGFSDPVNFTFEGLLNAFKADLYDLEVSGGRSFVVASATSRFPFSSARRKTV